MFFFHGADINVCVDGRCATAPRILAWVSYLVPDVDNLFHVLHGDRVEVDGVAVEGLVELDVPQSRSRHGEASNVCKPSVYFLAELVSGRSTSVK